MLPVTFGLGLKEVVLINEIFNQIIHRKFERFKITKIRR